MRTFYSDNIAGPCPEALAALARCSDGSHQRAYGNDEWTAEAVGHFRRIFGSSTEAFFVATGTAANTLAVAALTEPWQVVLCSEHAHWNCDESTAPERLTGCRTHTLKSTTGKIGPDDLRGAVLGEVGDVHAPQPGVVTISNTTELGLVYRADELAHLCATAHELGFRVHVDGSRFANAVAALGCDPRALSVDAGVDALSFGGAKNGLAFGEAVLFFRQGDGRAFERAVHAFPFLRKGSGHLLSKQRFVGAQFSATLEHGAWLDHARHANRLARRLADGLAALGLEPRFPCEANGVFVCLPEPIERALLTAGHRFQHFGDPRWRLARLMCGFDAREDEVDALIADVARLRRELG